MNMIGNLGSALFVNNIMNLVSIGGWDLAFMVWIGMHLAAVVCWAFLAPDVSIGEVATVPESNLGESGPQRRDSEGFVAESDITGTREDKRRE